MPEHVRKTTLTGEFHFVCSYEYRWPELTNYTSHLAVERPNKTTRSTFTGSIKSTECFQYPSDNLQVDHLFAAIDARENKPKIFSNCVNEFHAVSTT